MGLGGDVTGRSRQPVVGYISNSNAAAAAPRRQDYGTGSTVPVAVVTSTSVMRSLESPALYNAQPRGVVHQPSPRRFWQTSRQTEDLQSELSTSIEERDFFRYVLLLIQGISCRTLKAYYITFE